MGERVVITPEMTVTRTVRQESQFGLPTVRTVPVAEAEGRTFLQFGSREKVVFDWLANRKPLTGSEVILHQDDLLRGLEESVRSTVDPEELSMSHISEIMIHSGALIDGPFEEATADGQPPKVIAEKGGVWGEFRDLEEDNWILVK